MYICQLCGVQVPSGVHERKLVLETRVRSYPRREKVHTFSSHEECRAKRKHRKRVDDPGGVGREIVRELRVCPAYVARQEKLP